MFVTENNLYGEQSPAPEAISFVLNNFFFLTFPFYCGTIKTSLNVALKNQIGSRVMKFWLPDLLYRSKPLLIILFAALLVWTSDILFVKLFSFGLVCYALLIMCVRLMWSDRSSKTIVFTVFYWLLDYPFRIALS